MADLFDVGELITEANDKLGTPGEVAPPPDTSLPPSDATATISDSPDEAQAATTGQEEQSDASVADGEAQQQQQQVADVEDPIESPNLARVRTHAKELDKDIREKFGTPRP